MSLRRFYLSKRLSAADRGNEPLAMVWQHKQEHQPGGIELPEGFPCREALAEVGYVAQADLAGATEAELVEWVGISTREARTVLAAAAALE